MPSGRGGRANLRPKLSGKRNSFELLELFEPLDKVLMGGAVVAAGEWLALTRPALARHRLAPARHAVGVDGALRQRREKRSRESDVVLDHHVDAKLVRQR